jgi:hypothetical protein
MKKTAILSVLAIAACVATTPTTVRPYQLSSGELGQATAAIRELLRDPESMQTRNIVGYRTDAGDRIICGEYNSRNGFGGYGGFNAFYVRFLANGTMKRLADESDYVIAGYACRQAASGVINLPAD